MAKDIQVVPEGTRWRVKTGDTVGSIHETKAAAERHAYEMARERRVAVIMHKSDGTRQWRRIPAEVQPGKARSPYGRRKAAPARARREHPAQLVMFRDDEERWIVSEEGQDFAKRRFPSKYQAINFAREEAYDHESDVVVHLMDGTEQARWNPRTDPWRPTLIYLSA